MEIRIRQERERRKGTETGEKEEKRFEEKVGNRKGKRMGIRKKERKEDGNQKEGKERGWELERSKRKRMGIRKKERKENGNQKEGKESEWELERRKGERMGIRKKDGKRDRKEGCQKGLEGRMGTIRERRGIQGWNNKKSVPAISNETERQRGREEEKCRRMEYVMPAPVGSFLSSPAPTSTKDHAHTMDMRPLTCLAGPRIYLFLSFRRGVVVGMLIMLLQILSEISL